MMVETLTQQQLNQAVDNYSMVLAHSLLADGLNITHDNKGNINPHVDLSGKDDLPSLKPFIHSAIVGTPGEEGAYLDLDKVLKNFREEVKRNPDFVCRRFADNAMKLHGEEIAGDVGQYFANGKRPDKMDYTDPGLLWKLLDVVTEVFGCDVDGLQGQNRLFHSQQRSGSGNAL